MKHSTWLRVLGGTLAIVALAGWDRSASAQCACGGATNGGFEIYESIPGEEMATPEALLREVDDPTRVIYLSVIVNEKAVVSINGEPTETKGNLRPYIVRGLTPGKKYKFTVEGLVKTESGAEYFAKDEVVLSAGESKQVVLQVRRRNRTPPPPLAVLPAPVAAAAAR
jgi:uncharacterized protein (TIGR03000 family)